MPLLADLPTQSVRTGRRADRGSRVKVRYLVVTGLIAGGFASAIWTGAPIYRQQAAIGTLRKLGAFINSTPRGPRSLRDWIGNERMLAFDTIDFIYLDGRQIQDDDLSVFAGLHDIKG